MTPPPARSRDDDRLPMADDADVVEVGETPVSAEFEEAPDTALDLFGSGLGGAGDVTARDKAPAVATPAEVKVVVGRPVTPPPEKAAPAEAPKHRPKLLGRAIVERTRIK